MLFFESRDVPLGWSICSQQSLHECLSDAVLKGITNLGSAKVFTAGACPECE
jgi:hypothetical protein